MTDMHGLVAKAVSGSREHDLDLARHEGEIPGGALSGDALYERDMRLYHRALKLGMGMAGQVAFSADNGLDQG